MQLVPVAAKRMAIMRGGKRIEVQPGDPVPEAAEWSHVKAWERMGWIRWVPVFPASALAPPEPPAALPQVAPPSPPEDPASPAVEEAPPQAVDSEAATADDLPRRRRRGKPDSEVA